MMDGEFPTISVLKIYIDRENRKRSLPWWNRVFVKPLSQCLVSAALEAGITRTAIALSDTQTDRDSKHIPSGTQDGFDRILTTCVELVGTHAQLEQFIFDNDDLLAKAKYMTVKDIRLSSLYLNELDLAIQVCPHVIEYIAGAHGPMTVKHVLTLDSEWN